MKAASADNRPRRSPFADLDPMAPRHFTLAHHRLPQEDTFAQVGGHTGSFQPCDNGHALIKNSSLTEYQFYEKVFKDRLPICQFMPKYYGALRSRSADNFQIKIENLSQGMTAPGIMDVKIGCRSFSYGQLRKQGVKRGRACYKSLRMFISDKLSSSRDLGFRIVSHNKGVKSSAQYGLMDPAISIKQFSPLLLSTKKLIINELCKLLEFVESPYFNRYSLIGTSVLICFDEHSAVPVARVKLIDFAHANSDGINDDKRIKNIKNFRYGVRRLIRLLNTSFEIS